MLGPWYVTTDARRRSAWGDPCQTRANAGRVTIDGRTLPLSVDAVPAFEVWERIRARHGYRLTGDDTGFYNCRHMQHNPALPYSYHSWGMALDVNWLENPAGSKLVTDIPQAMIDDLLAVRTGSGARLFRWGGDWDWDGISSDHSYIDAMHWEVVAHPLDLATGIVDPNEEKPMHKHTPMPSDLPRAWADGDWEDYAEHSGTKVDTRAHTLYREDLSWFHQREIAPLERQIATLQRQVADLRDAVDSLNVKAGADKAVREHLRQTPQ